MPLWLTHGRGGRHAVVPNAVSVRFRARFPLHHVVFFDGLCLCFMRLAATSLCVSWLDSPIGNEKASHLSTRRSSQRTTRCQCSVVPRACVTWQKNCQITTPILGRLFGVGLTSRQTSFGVTRAPTGGTTTTCYTALGVALLEARFSSVQAASPLRCHLSPARGSEENLQRALQIFRSRLGKNRPERRRAFESPFLQISFTKGA